MNYRNDKCEEFLEKLGSKMPAPGGGGASALVAAVAVALGRMVGSLTSGKKRYSQYQRDIEALDEEAKLLIDALLTLIDEDEANFLPLANCYKMPENTEEEKITKKFAMEEALLVACQCPLLILKKCARAVELLEIYLQIGTPLAISDCGCAAALIKGAMESAGLNVFINTKYMENEEIRFTLNTEAEKIVSEYGERANKIFIEVRNRLK